MERQDILLVVAIITAFAINGAVQVRSEFAVDDVLPEGSDVRNAMDMLNQIASITYGSAAVSPKL